MISERSHAYRTAISPCPTRPTQRRHKSSGAAKELGLSRDGRAVGWPESLFGRETCGTSGSWTMLDGHWIWWFHFMPFQCLSHASHSLEVWKIWKWKPAWRVTNCEKSPRAGVHDASGHWARENIHSAIKMQGKIVGWFYSTGLVCISYIHFPSLSFLQLCIVLHLRSP